MPPLQYIVEGGHRLAGTIEPSGNKNAALPIIAAALLTEHPVTLQNVPRIRDTETLVELIRSVGASAEWQGRNTLAIHAKKIRAADLDPELCARIRASILLAGPLLARCGEVMLPPPGGDVIGRRRLDTHFLAFEQLGATVTATDRLEFRASTPHGRRRVPRRAQRDRHRKRADGRGGGARHHAICATSPPSRMCRTSRISWWRSAPASRASAPTP